MGQNSPYSYSAYGQAGIPQPYSTALENLGFVGTPFAGIQQTFEDQVKYQQVLKNILDQQLGAFNNGNNTAALPFNMRNLFNSAAGVLTDPMYGIIGAPGMFTNGYQMGALPGNMSTAEQGWYAAAHGYPGIAAPHYVGAYGQPGANNNQSQGIGLLTPQQQNPNTGVNQGPGGQYAQQAQNNADIGTHSGLDSSGNVITINKTYGQMTDAEKGQANAFAHNMSG